jgi:hypothetical protein
MPTTSSKPSTSPKLFKEDLITMTLIPTLTTLPPPGQSGKNLFLLKIKKLNLFSTIKRII